MHGCVRNVTNLGIYSTYVRTCLPRNGKEGARSSLSVSDTACRAHELALPHARIWNHRIYLGNCRYWRPRPFDLPRTGRPP